MKGLHSLDIINFASLCICKLQLVVNTQVYLSSFIYVVKIYIFNLNIILKYYLYIFLSHAKKMTISKCKKTLIVILFSLPK